MSYPFRKVETLLMLLLTCVTYELITRLDEPKRGFANIKRNMGSILACGEGQQAIAIAAVTMATARAAARTRSSRILPTCGGKRRERIETMPTRGEDDPL
jgi:hypothetical protein